MPKKSAKKGFSFNTSPKVKKRKTGLTEETLLESNPQWAELAESNDKLRQAQEVKKQKDKMSDHTEIHTYLVITFQSRAQKLEFMEKIPDVHCIDEVFIDGETFAQSVGIEITPNQIPVIKAPVSERFRKLTENP